MYVCVCVRVRVYEYEYEKQKTALIFNFHHQAQEVRMNNGIINLFKGKNHTASTQAEKINNF